jgi:hypothetical protein
MALIEKTNPVGLDLRIAKFNAYLFDRLGFADDVYESYPRIYSNKAIRDGREIVVPEHFISGKDYKNVAFDDTFALSSFYYQDTQDTHAEQVGTVRVSLIVQAQLDKLYPSAPHRFDEELKGRIEQLSNKYYAYDQFKLVDTFITVDNVYRDFTTSHLEFTDMHPFYVVRFEYLVRYNPNETC